MKKDVKRIVREGYGRIADSGGSCSCGGSCGVSMDKNALGRSIGYIESDLKAAPGANLGLGCGNPIAIGEIREGMTVLDLGSGAGFDCFLAAEKVGKRGKVIGVDMTEQMIRRARENAEKGGFRNVEFRLGDIESLPVGDESVDVVISNCVINLAPDKPKVFGEAYRVLKKGGRMLVSDMVLLKELSQKQRKDHKLIVGCVGGAVLKGKYLEMIKHAGFRIRLLSEDAKISKRQYEGLPVESLSIEAIK